MRLIISIALLLLLSGCADLGYYWHSADGHMSLMNQRVDIDEMLADESLDAALRERLLLVRDIRQFSIERLELPANGSYTNFVELDRPYVLKNLFAAPEFSTRLYKWCYPVIGCTSYRGYFDEERMQRYVADLESQGLEIYIGQVAAYSTLGWFDDPILSSFVHWPDYRLAGLLFHELTHQQIYIDDDTTFNESLATAVQQAGTRLWLESRGQTRDIERLQQWLEYRGESIALIESTRAQLTEIYARSIDDNDKRRLKQAAFDTARENHREIAAKHGISGGFTRWFADGLNNAKVGSVSTYNARLDAFLNMLNAQQMNFGNFFAYVERLGRLDKPARDRCLDAWENAHDSTDAHCPSIS